MLITAAGVRRHSPVIVHAARWIAMDQQLLFLSSGNPAASFLARLGSVTQKPAGCVLFRRGDLAEGVFVIAHGRLELSFENHRSPNRILGPGEIAGLPAVVSGEPYSLTARTKEPCELVFIPRAAVLATLADNPGFGMALVDMLAHEVHHLREVWQDEYNRTASAAPH
jgi:CRP-like cAMP-binding protein